MDIIENWFSERYSDYLQLSFRVRDQLISVKTDYQRIDVFDTYSFGRLLSIDGTVQLTDQDEYIYHEMITEVPYVYAKRKPQSALVIGGGDGGAALRLLKLGLKRIVNVEIDSQVVEVSRRFFPNLASSFDDPACHLVIGDGIKFVSETDEKFDLIVVDSTDPEGPAEGLFSANFYRSVKRVLSDGGIVVVQSGSPFYQPRALELASSGLREVFSNVKTYTAFIPTYPSGLWSFTMAGDEIMDAPLRSAQGRYFNSEVARGAFMLPEFVKQVIHKAER